MDQMKLDGMHARLSDLMAQYRSGIVLFDEFLWVADKLRASYKGETLAGLIDPATGLKYPETFLPNL